MSWWQERKARRKLVKLIGKDEAGQMIQELKHGHQQLEMLRDGLREKESDTYRQLIGTINQIIEGKAPATQKKLISIKLVESAKLTDYERQDLLQQIESIYQTGA